MFRLLNLGYSFARVLSIFGAAMLCATFAHGQAATGSVQGVVMDPNGAVVPGAKLVLRCDCRECPERPCEECCPTGSSRTVTSDSEGLFSIEQIPTGVYSIRAEASGFATTEVTGIRVTVGSAQKVEITLGAGESSVVSAPEGMKKMHKETMDKIANLVVKVINETTDQPIDNAKVSLRLACDCLKECPGKPCDECCPIGNTIVAFTEKDGVIKFNGPPGKYTVLTDFGAYSKDVLVNVKPGATETVKVELLIRNQD